MTSAGASVDLVKRKQVRLRARPGLQITRRQEGGRRVCVVKDPVSLAYFHLEESQCYILERMDGTRTLEDLQKAYEQEYRPERLTLEELEAFAGQLIQSGLAQNPAISSGAYLFEKHEDERKLQRLARLNPFYLKIPLVDPDRILNAMLPVGRVFFHPLAILAALMGFVAALALVVTRWRLFCDQLPTYEQFFVGHNLLYLWLSVGVVKILHELGHALCSKVVGGAVEEVGVVFLFFFPTLYCNVTDSCTLPERWKRIAIGAAGIYVELIIATLAVFTWWLTDPNTIVNNICLDLALVCGVHTLVFNANPLMRFDGYFILSDAVAVPNLAQVSSRRLLNACLRWFGAPAADTPEEKRTFLLCYGLASLVYRWVVTAGLLWLLFLFLKERRLEWLGASLVLAAALALVGVPLRNLVRTLQTFGRFPTMKASRVVLSAGVLAAAIGVVGFLPLPLSVRGLALVQAEPERQHRLEIPGPGGFLEQVCVRDGERVQRGDILAVLKNPALENKLKLNEMEQSLRMQQRHVLFDQLASLVSTAGNTEGHEEVEHALIVLAEEQTVLRAQRERLVLRAPADGVVLTLPSWETKGKWLAEGDAFCLVADDDCLRVALLVEPADRQLVREGATAWFLGHGVGVTGLGVVSGISQVDEKSIPPQLSGRSGGDIPSKHDPATSTEQPFKQHFLVTVRLQGPDPATHVGTLGRLRIDAGSATLWWRLRRWIGSTFTLRAI